jgi:hypothetical protein
MPKNKRAEQTPQSFERTQHAQQSPQSLQEQPSANSDSHRRKHGKKWRELHPRSLLRAMGAQGAISEDKVRALVETGYINPVISLYIALGPDKVAP